MPFNPKFLTRDRALPFEAAPRVVKKPPWILAAALAGLLVTAVSVFLLVRYTSGQQSMTRVPVPSRDIAVYTEIGAQDLEWRSIPVGAFEPGAARAPEEIVGRVALATLYKGEQVRVDRLAALELFAAGVQLVAVNVDFTRSGGGETRPGDLVDVYWLTGDQAPAALVASDVRVVGFADAQGRLIGQRRDILPVSGQEQSLLPAVAILAVKPRDVGLLVRGAWHESKQVVLVKKFGPGGGPARPTPVDEVGGETGGQER